jgi:hypothetical protein
MPFCIEKIQSLHECSKESRGSDLAGRQNRVGKPHPVSR